MSKRPEIALPLEADIVADWQRNQEIIVSVICAAYNQASYIADAIEGFLRQQTNFPFEIIIHDDASTDGTSEIISRYAAAYPNLILPIYQRENQYSRGKFKPGIYAATFARGRYIAFCEGDDYWIDSQKLQRQIKWLEMHPNVDFSFHSAYSIREDVRKRRVTWRYERDRVIDLAELMNRYTSKFAPTASYVFRRSVIGMLPEWFVPSAPVGDYFIERYGAKRGGALYIDRPMSVYREMRPGSWNSETSKKVAVYREHVEKMLLCLELMIPDFPEHAPLLRKHAAKLLLNCAVRELEVGQTSQFATEVETSVAHYKYISQKQRLAYYLRHRPSLLRWPMRIRRLL